MWSSERKPRELGHIVLSDGAGKYAHVCDAAIWEIGDIGAQEFLTRDQRRFFHTHVEQRSLVESTIDDLKAHWDMHYAARFGYWDRWDPIALEYGSRCLLIIPDMVFDSAMELCEFVEKFNREKNGTLPTDFLKRKSYRWPLGNQTLHGLRVCGVRGPGYDETFNSLVGDYCNEVS